MSQNLKRYKSFLDMSSVDLDGSHTTALRGGECCGYQGRKKRKTTNAIYVTDSQGILQNYMACPVSANYGRLLKSFFYLIYVVLVDGR